MNIIIILFFVLISLILVIISRALIFSKNKQDFSHNNTLTEKEEFNPKISVERLSKIIQFETISYDDKTKYSTEEFSALHDFLHKSYPEVFTQLELEKFGKFAMLLKWNGEDTTMDPIMLMAHQDVVPVPEQEIDQWKFPPFSGTITSEHVYGRGALDMKSTLIAILEAITILIKKNFKLKRSIYIYFGDDEEIGGPTAKAVSECLEERNIKFSYIIDEGGAIVDELIPGINNPLCLIGIGQKGALNLEIKVNGESGHAAKPPKRTTIDILGDAVAKVKKHEMPIHKDSLVYTLIQNIAPYMGFTQRILLNNFWLFKKIITRKLSDNPLMNAMMRTTIVPTIFESGTKNNIIPEMARSNLNCRLYPGDTKFEVVNHIASVLKNENISIRVLDDFNALQMSGTDTFGYKVICDTVKEVSPAPLIISPILVIGGTDSRHFRKLSNGVYNFLYTRGTMEEYKGYHGINERIPINNFLDGIKFYCKLIENSQ